MRRDQARINPSYEDRPALQRRIQQDLLTQETRRRIHEHIGRSPGIHLRGLHKLLGIPVSTVEYHLRQLERADIVHSRARRLRRSYYPSWITDRHDMECLYFLQKERTRTILEILIENPEATLDALEQRMPIAMPTISYHLKELSTAGIVRPFWLNGKKYFVLDDEGRVRSLLERYPELQVDEDETPER